MLEREFSILGYASLSYSSFIIEILRFSLLSKKERAKKKKRWYNFNNFNDFNHVKLLGQIDTPFVKNEVCGTNFICERIKDNPK